MNAKDLLIIGAMRPSPAILDSKIGFVWDVLAPVKVFKIVTLVALRAFLIGRCLAFRIR